MSNAIEVGLGTVGRLRILRELISHQGQALTKYQLAKLTHLKNLSLRRDLEVLIRLGWVEELPYRPKKYRVNLEREEVRHLAEFFQRVDYWAKRRI